MSDYTLIALAIGVTVVIILVWELTKPRK